MRMSTGLAPLCAFCSRAASLAEVRIPMDNRYVETDYLAMISSQMFRLPPVPFADVLERCRSLEQRINEARCVGV